MESVWPPRDPRLDPGNWRLLVPPPSSGCWLCPPSIPTAQAVFKDAAVGEPCGVESIGQADVTEPCEGLSINVQDFLEGGCRDLLILQQPKTSLAKSPCFLTLPPTDMEQPVSLFDFPLPSAYGASLGFHPGSPRGCDPAEWKPRGHSLRGILALPLSSPEKFY